MARSDLKRNRALQEQALSHLHTSAAAFFTAMEMYFERFPIKKEQSKLLMERMATIQEAMKECFSDM